MSSLTERVRSTRGWTCAWFCAFSCFGCARPLDERRCSELLDHYTDRLIEQSRPDATAGEREQLRARAREKALLDPEFRACPARVSETAFNCAAKAASTDEIERCLM